eukprot:TRINITY_DN9772_c0_g2_i3.p1 TRINITY_DN9772_c0_g2~~TRINITY_DN9772_c0_g2_i3.p1  ORF type:complete len:116 (-),score=27.16 TRINITY_DN9772_c0_g2_i3:174-521(-)
MDDFQQPEEITIPQEEVAVIVKDAVDSVVGGNMQYDHAKVGQWCNTIIETCMKKLKELNKPFKFVVTCLIMRRTGAGLHTASSTIWDITTDQLYIHREESNKYLLCITHVFCIAL